jgi:hypothetical protein
MTHEKTPELVDWDEWAAVTLTRTPPSSFDELDDAMRGCEQAPGHSVWDHGAAVWACLQELIAHMKGDSPVPEGRWRLPDWVADYKAELLANLHHEGRLGFYTQYHDCGKPYCLTVDDTGRRHFPHHVEASCYVWACLGGNDVVRHLIGNDMVLHTASAEDIADKLASRWSCEDSVTLLLVALAEIHANCTMFGGIASTSFKMKWKTLDRRGRQVCKRWFPGVKN